ncbi:MAG: DUF309 domain-containing protein [Paenibacillus dendritiformis]|uniref:DUF309 domain-containing protein n=1 Tax=Paenibacillus dendritiformis TaxID=130049 RepID=UPI00143CF4E0|nr:DUF309 domain-containing protein [Paenibacillus dendritiformis]MDU5140667.1 DUF309 domain-containing protein [Paenibacillus dendritiformis]NKI21184.1 DUF309 domain-containing protein [Paenibacillus dendritiformis]NRF97760.1 DUF309 domain-containing protein [Paenibacillus dendritiformis]
MEYPTAYIEYMLEFHGTRDWFECHEIMEEQWKAESSAERKVWWLTLVQIAVGLYHERRGNLAGAGKMLRSALAHAPSVAWAELGINGKELVSQLTERVEAYRHGGLRDRTYAEWNFPIADPGLAALCEARCLARGWPWCSTGSEQDESILHRHKLRDREPVMEARREAQRLKGRNRKQGHT